MKTLQENFTTPEQSKRLLELGVPADSADCYYDSWKQVQWRQLSDMHSDFFEVYNHYTPCWSVGRLMEIMLNSQIDTGTYALGIMLDKDTFNTESLIDIIDEDIKEFDFSKLEE